MSDVWKAPDLTSRAVEDYLNEKYKESGVTFHCQGMHVRAFKKNETKEADVDVLVKIPYQDKEVILSDEYKEELHKYAIQHAIYAINQQLGELK